MRWEFPDAALKGKKLKEIRLEVFPLGDLPLAQSASTGDRENTMQLMDGLAELRGQGRMTWIDEEHGWVAAPEDIMNALSSEGFEECKREMTTSRRDSRPAGGVWQGIDPRTGCVASMIWVNRPTSPDAIVFMAINGESLTGAGAPSTDRDPYREDGGEA